MAKLLLPPPSIEDFISYFVQWIARSMHARITVKVYWNENKHFTEEYDGRV